MRNIARLASAAALVLAGPVRAEMIVAVSDTLVISFDSATPNVSGIVALTGLAVGDQVVGMDRRPATRQVFLLARTPAGGGRLYRLDTLNGVATFHANLSADPADATAPFTLLTGLRFAMDFNPVVDRIRIVSHDNSSYRVNPNTGLTITDDPVNPGDPDVAAAAYLNNFPGTTTTTLFVLDATADALYIQNPPNSGLLNQVGPLGVDFLDTATFDISSVPGAATHAWAALRVGGITGFYAIDTATGAATLVGNVVGNPALNGMTVSEIGIVFGNGFE